MWWENEKYQAIDPVTETEEIRELTVMGDPGLDPGGGTLSWPKPSRSCAEKQKQKQPRTNFLANLIARKDIERNDKI